MQATHLTPSLTSRKAQLEKELSHVAGCSIEFTFRGGLDMTISAEGNKVRHMEKCKAFFGDAVTHWEVSYDSECDYTCAYFTVKG